MKTAMEEKKEPTRILYANEEELRKRKERIPVFRNRNNKRNYLLDPNYEKTKALVDLMVLEGMREEFIEELLTREPDQEYALTLDFLHCAALILGEQYVKENLMGKSLSAREAIRDVREAYHNQEMKPYREIYGNFEQRLQAAKTGEAQTEHQLEILKLQSAHAEAMYKQRMESAKVQFRYELRLSHEKATVREEKASEKISGMEKELTMIKAYAEDKKKEAAYFQKEEEQLRNALKKKQEECNEIRKREQRLQEELRKLHSELEKENTAGEEASVKQEEKITEPNPSQKQRRCWRWDGKENEKNNGLKKEETGLDGKNAKSDHPAEAGTSKAETFTKNAEPKSEIAKNVVPNDRDDPEPMDDRNMFCMEVLGNHAFSCEQVEILLPCLQDEAIPVSTLRRICNPQLPAQNMKLFVKYLRGGKECEKKQ